MNKKMVFCSEPKHIIILITFFIFINLTFSAIFIHSEEFLIENDEKFDGYWVSDLFEKEKKERIDEWQENYIAYNIERQEQAKKIFKQMFDSRLFNKSDMYCDNYKYFHQLNPKLFPTAATLYADVEYASTSGVVQDIEKQIRSIESMNMILDDVICANYVINGDLEVCGNVRIKGRLTVVTGLNATHVLAHEAAHIQNRCSLLSILHKGDLIIPYANVWVLGKVHIGGNLLAGEIKVDAGASVFVGIRGARESIRVKYKQNDKKYASQSASLTEGSVIEITHGVNNKNINDFENFWSINKKDMNDFLYAFEKNMPIVVELKCNMDYVNEVKSQKKKENFSNYRQPVKNRGKNEINNYNYTYHHSNEIYFTGLGEYIGDVHTIRFMVHNSAKIIIYGNIRSEYGFMADEASTLYSLCGTMNTSLTDGIGITLNGGSILTLNGLNLNSFLQLSLSHSSFMYVQGFMHVQDIAKLSMVSHLTVLKDMKCPLIVTNGMSFLYVEKNMYIKNVLEISDFSTIYIGGMLRTYVLQMFNGGYIKLKGNLYVSSFMTVDNESYVNTEGKKMYITNSFHISNNSILDVHNSNLCILNGDFKQVGSSVNLFDGDLYVNGSVLIGRRSKFYAKKKVISKGFIPSYSLFSSSFSGNENAEKVKKKFQNEKDLNEKEIQKENIEEMQRNEEQMKIINQNKNIQKIDNFLHNRKLIINESFLKKEDNENEKQQNKREKEKEQKQEEIKEGNKEQIGRVDKEKILQKKTNKNMLNNKELNKIVYVEDKQNQNYEDEELKNSYLNENEIKKVHENNKEFMEIYEEKRIVKEGEDKKTQETETTKEHEKPQPAFYIDSSDVYIEGDLITKESWAHIKGKSKVYVRGGEGVRIYRSFLTLMGGGILNVSKGNIKIDDGIVIQRKSKIILIKGSLNCLNLKMEDLAQVYINEGGILVQGNAVLDSRSEMYIQRSAVFQGKILYVDQAAKLTAGAIGMTEGDILVQNRASLQSIYGDIISNKSIICQDGGIIRSSRHIIAKNGDIVAENNSFIKSNSEMMVFNGTIRKTIESTIIALIGEIRVVVFVQEIPEYLFPDISILSKTNQNLNSDYHYSVISVDPFQAFKNGRKWNSTKEGISYKNDNILINSSDTIYHDLMQEGESSEKEEKISYIEEIEKNKFFKKIMNIPGIEKGNKTAEILNKNDELNKFKKKEMNDEILNKKKDNYLVQDFFIDDSNKSKIMKKEENYEYDDVKSNNNKNIKRNSYTGKKDRKNKYNYFFPHNYDENGKYYNNNSDHVTTLNVSKNENSSILINNSNIAKGLPIQNTFNFSNIYNSSFNDFILQPEASSLQSAFFLQNDDLNSKKGEEIFKNKKRVELREEKRAREKNLQNDQLINFNTHNTMKQQNYGDDKKITMHLNENIKELKEKEYIGERSDIKILNLKKRYYNKSNGRGSTGMSNRVDLGYNRAN